MPPKRKKLRLPGKCIFCDSLGVTKEHLVAEWISNLIPRKPTDSRIHTVVEININADGSLSSRPSSRKLQGSLHSQKLKVACRPCNNEWMSRVENAAKPVLSSLIEGKPLVLNRDQQTGVARWVTKTIMVAEAQSDSNVTFTLDDRNNLRLTGAVPGKIEIWLARYNGTQWSTKLHRAPFHVSITPATGDLKTLYTQSVSLGLGNLLIFASISDPPGVIRFSPTAFSFGKKLVKIWPDPHAEIGIIGNAITDSEADTLSEALLGAMRSLSARI